MKNPDLRIVHCESSYYITEITYDEEGNPREELGPECGILSYWASVKELKRSYKLAGKAFDQPVIERLLKNRNDK